MAAPTSRAACIPLGHAWSSPFARWQGPLAETSALDLAEAVTRRALADRGVPAAALDRLVLGWTVPQPAQFYGAPTLAARLGAEGVTGPMVSQACATSVAALRDAAAGIALGDDGLTLVVVTDRTSNGPTLLWPAPSAQAGAPVTEHWVLDNFARDPWALKPMVDTAEQVAAEGGFTRAEIDDVTLQRYDQYATALADDRAFQRRWMVPVVIPRRRGPDPVVDADQGVKATSAEALAKLTPGTPNGVITFGSQTHPADGCAGAVVTTEDRARELSGGAGIVRLLGFGVARVEKAAMPKAPVPAAKAALAAAGITIDQVDAVSTHNPFAVNDLWFAKQTGFPLDRMNAHGCSLVYGHPQAPTGARAVTELIETLRERGGGTGLFTGCAAGDTGAAVVVRVED